MPELPEIARLATQMNAHLAGKRIVGLEAIQPKSLNLEPAAFQQAVAGQAIRSADYRGKWVRLELEDGWLLLNLGMGGEALLTDREHLPEKRRLILDFADGACLAINFWWFGSLHFCGDGEQHPQVAKLGPNVLDLSPADLAAILARKRGRLKDALLDQNRMAGIGNAYVHDILFFAGLHPLRRTESLRPDEVARLHSAIQKGLRVSLDKGGAFYEVDLFGLKGGFTMEDIMIGYKEGKPCPSCGTLIEKIKTGGTSSYICPQCQPLPGPTD